MPEILDFLKRRDYDMCCKSIGVGGVLFQYLFL